MRQMNLILIGGKPAIKIKEVLQKTLDDLEIMVFEDTNVFKRDASNKQLSNIHKIILMEDAVDKVSDEEMYAFVDFLQIYYPSIRLITICKRIETTKYLGDLILSPYSLHFNIDVVKSKMLVDLVVQDIATLKKRYTQYIYIHKVEATESIIEDEIIDGMNEEEINEMEEEPQKRGLLRKVFGVGPKGKGKKKSSMKGELKPIGQGQGVDEFSTTEKTIFDKIGESDLDNEYEEEDNDVDFDMFDKSEGDIGLGYTPEFEDEYSEEEYSEEDIDDEYKEEENLDEDVDNEYKEEEISHEDNEIENEPNFDETPEEESNLDIAGEIEVKGLPENTEVKIPEIKGLGDLKDTILKGEIKKPSIKKAPTAKKVEIVEEVDDSDVALFGGDMSSLMAEYEKKNTKVVEKVVEKVVHVTDGSKTNVRNKNGIRLILVTGDRRSGVTKLAMNLANIFSKQENTLLVDFDRYRKGVVGYIGVGELIEEPEHIENGLNHIKNENMLKDITYLYRKGGFYVLTSMYGEEIEDEQMELAQKIIAQQKYYSTVVVDCPMENLYLLTDIIYSSKILICVEDNRIGVTNTIININSSVEDKVMTPLFNNSSIVASRKSNIESLREELAYVENVFGLDETPCNWCNLDIIGSIKGTKEIAKKLEG